MTRIGWDKAGAPTSIDDAIWGETRYTYDVNGQVTKAEFGDGFTEKFAYDPAKNVAGVALQGPGLDASVSKLFDWRSTPGGVVHLARGPNGESIALIHDICGRVIERRVDRKGFRPKTWRYGWDAHDRLVRCDNPEGETWFYRYDPFGRRLTKVRKLNERELAWTAQKHAALVPIAAREATKLCTWPEPPNGAGAGGNTRPPVIGTLFTWDGDVVAEEAPLRLDGTTDRVDAIRWHYEPESFRPLAKQAPDDQLLPIVTNHLGTPHEMFDEGAALRWAARYTTWDLIWGVKAPPEPANDDCGRAIYPRDSGNPSAALDNLPLKAGSETARYECPMRFPEQWADAENDCSYNYHRIYDPITSQYMSPDPIKLLGGSRPQSYVQNPAREVDQFGLAQSAAARANQIHDVLDPIAQKQRSTAVLQTTDGSQIVGSGVRDLTPAQRQILVEGETAAKAKGLHAETTVLQHAKYNGLQPSALGASRPFYDGCQQAITNSGGVITGPNTAVWPK